ncbi:hypothetical protein D9619_001175 [Psilocybe cf. subviscida]|uniref:Extracellular membrane protein CFEM domain-containing protein n=1 Tax=Psilocybe cf. subviscida TaxID=2480587 RepID=A0A8H5BGL1_9AGAR|nr:hypothetical protein D9619_001175 [Psilocybe cf. subviscida]
MLRLLLAAFLASCFAAWASPANLQHDSRHVIMLDGRQLPLDPTVPSQCQNDCTPTVLAILDSNQCSIVTCCSTTFNTGFFNCAKCVGQASSTSNFTIIQETLDMLHNQCASVGISLPKLTFPGQNPNRQLSSVASVASTRAASGSQAAASSSAPGSNSTVATPSSTGISQITITALDPTITSPTIAQSTVTSPANTAPASAGTRAICAPFIQSWAIASIAAIPFLGTLYLGV